LGKWFPHRPIPHRVLIVISSWALLAVKIWFSGLGVITMGQSPIRFKKIIWLRNHHKKCLGMRLKIWINDWNSESESNLDHGTKNLEQTRSTSVSY